MAQLTELRAKRIAPSDKPLADGTVKGLWLVPGSRKGQAKWILRFVSPLSGKRRDMGLGTYPEVTILQAREAGNLARKTIARGQDPIDERQTEKAARASAANALTFEQAALRVHDELKGGWKNSKHADQWVATLRQYVIAQIGRRKVADLGPQDFSHVLRPIWLTKPETATRVKQRCRTVMKWCWAHGMVASNPMDVVDHLLPQQPGKRVRTLHQPSMPWKEVPEFVQRTMRHGPSNVTRALLEFLILTAARSGEARAMTWGEVDLDTAVWTIPAIRMKAKVTHRVPLSGPALRIVLAQHQLHPNSDLVFPAPRGSVLSDMVLTKFLRDHGATSSEKGRVATAHGFRSSFRDWASENGYARDLAERALAHAIRNQAEAAYHRTDLLEQRRRMMEDWAAFVSGDLSEKLIHGEPRFQQIRAVRQHDSPEP